MLRRLVCEYLSLPTYHESTSMFLDGVPSRTSGRHGHLPRRYNYCPSLYSSNQCLWRLIDKSLFKSAPRTPPLPLARIPRSVRNRPPLITRFAAEVEHLLERDGSLFRHAYFPLRASPMTCSANSPTDDPTASSIAGNAAPG